MRNSQIHAKKSANQGVTTGVVQACRELSETLDEFLIIVDLRARHRYTATTECLFEPYLTMQKLHSFIIERLFLPF